MFRIIFHDIILFRQIVDVIKDIVSQVCIFISNEGLEIQALDPALISMTSLILQKEAFELLDCLKPCNIGVDLETFSKLLKCSHCTSDSCCTFVYEAESDTLDMSVKDAKSNRDFSAKLRLLDINMEYRKMNAHFEKYDCKARLNAMDFYEVFRDLSQFSKDVNIQISDGQIQFTTASPGERGEDRVRLTFNNLKHVHMFSRENEQGIDENQQVVLNNFSLKYLFKIAKSHALSNSVRLFMSNDCCPFLISYKFPKQYGTLNFYLASLIE